MKKKFEVNRLEERIAPSSLNLGSLGNDLGNIESHANSLGTGDVGGGNASHLGSQDSGALSTGDIVGGNHAASNNYVDASGSASGNNVSASTSPNVNVSPTVSIG